MILELIQTVALLLALSLLHGFSMRALAARPRLAETASGLIFGTVCVVGMMLPITLAPGVIVDGRSVLLSMAAPFGGPLTGLVAGAIAGAYRLWLGGGGMIVGTTVIVLGVALGLAYRAAWARGWLARKPLSLFAFGVTVHALSMVLIAQIPEQSIASIYAVLGLPYLLIMGAATTLLGLLLQDLAARQQNERSLREREARLRAVAGAVPDIRFVLDENGRCLEVMTHDERLLYRDAESVLGHRLQDIRPEAVGNLLMTPFVKPSSPAPRPSPSTPSTPQAGTATSKGGSRPSKARARRGRWCSSSRTSPVGSCWSRNAASPQSPSSHSRA